MNNEKTGRLFASAGGELAGAGDEGGDDRVGASDGGKEGGGLELTGAELIRVGDKDPTGDLGVGVVEGVGSVSASSTRLRLGGGSSS